LTLFPKCFSSFDHSTCALSVSGQYLALEEIYLPFRAAFPNNSTRRRGFTWRTPLAKDGVLTLSDMPFQALRPWPTPKHPLQITIRTLKEPDFKFELLPLHSPLLGQSLLVSFPPLIDMLKFSGYPYLIRGRKQNDALRQVRSWALQQPVCCATRQIRTADYFEASPRAMAEQTPNTKRSLMGEMTLEQACPSEYQRAQCAFKNSMIH
jgi:hypothetical protein